MGLIYWIYPNLILANSNVGVEVIDILPAGSPPAARCAQLAGPVPATKDDNVAATT